MVIQKLNLQLSSLRREDQGASSAASPDIWSFSFLFFSRLPGVVYEPQSGCQASLLCNLLLLLFWLWLLWNFFSWPSGVV
jgi:hypothetical protein